MTKGEMPGTSNKHAEIL